MHLDQMTNAPREITVAGRTLTVSALTLDEWGVLQAWLKDHTTDPVVAAFDDLNRVRAAGVVVHDDDRKALFAQARQASRHWPPRVGSGEWFSLVQDTPEGPARFLAAVLRKHNPALTDDDLEAINEGATPEESQLIVWRALGYVPAPKAEGAADAPTPTTGDRPSPASSPAES